MKIFPNNSMFIFNSTDDDISPNISYVWGHLDQVCCNILAIHIKYDNSHIKLQVIEFICLMIWYCLEITSCVVTDTFYHISETKEYALLFSHVSLSAAWLGFWRNAAY